MLRSFLRKPLAVAAVLAFCLTGGLFAAADLFKDPLDVPAVKVVRQITSTPMVAITRAGDRLVAVGVRGLIIVSDDNGKHWVQAPAPVSSDLLDVYFPTAKDGWVVGQDGVVLHTRDGGNSWEMQLNGRMTQKLLTAHFQSFVNAGQAGAERYLRDMQFNYTDGPEQLLLSVWFEDAKHGFVAGSFGTLLATKDGGATWESWVEKVDVDRPYHYHCIRGTRQGVIISSEKGLVFRLDAAKQRFVIMPTGYNGSLFALVESEGALLALGLQGTVYRLAGAEGKWERVESGTTDALAGGTSLPEGGALLVTQSGKLLATRDNGAHFQRVPVTKSMMFTGVTSAGPRSAILVGLGGVTNASLQ